MVTAKSELPGELPSAVARYASVFHDVIGYRHQVASPLGAWLLLALCAPAAAGQDAAFLSELLGGTSAEVAASAAGLLGAPHPLVAAVAAVWSKQQAADLGWLASLPSAVTRGEIPDQGELDSWAREHTFGLIDRFPLQVSPDVYLLLATALATKVSWDRPFELAPATELGRSSPWAQRLARVLKSPDHPSHTAFICPTAEAGDVAVHLGQAKGGLLVASVIAEPRIAPADVLAVAHRIAIASALGQPAGERSLSDLPLGDWPLWSLREETSNVGAGQHCVAVLPAWSASNSYDLSDPRLGFAAAAAALGHGDPWIARQAAMASYSRTGFEAAAVTALAVEAMAMAPRRGKRRMAELRFGHPYAVVAVAADGAPGWRTPGAWTGIPVFSAWVAEPVNAGDK
jgi:hypothetical protein